jgi:hypothetical protein
MQQNAQETNNPNRKKNHTWAANLARKMSAFDGSGEIQ